MSYRADIDGLRAIAVLAVLFYHLELSCPGGYVGVDIFFVISGFLIAGKILRALKAERFCYRSFWKRRILRLLPALFVTTLVTLVVGYLLLLPQDLIDLGGALVAQPLLLANVYYWRTVQAGYFQDAPETRPLLHTWSLGIEEQFYLLFPILLVAIFNNRRLREYLFPILIICTITSLSLSTWLTPIKSVFSFFMIPTRAWELLVGALLVPLNPDSLPRLSRSALACFGLCFILYPVLSFNHETRFPGIAAVWPCLGTALVILTGPDTLVSRVLGSSTAVFLGKISYSLYLWHWPFVAYAHYLDKFDSFSSKLTLLVASIAAGFLSWRYIEEPFRGKPGKSTGTLLLLVLGYTVLCLVIGTLFLQGRGYPQRWRSVDLESLYKASRTYKDGPLDWRPEALPKLGDTSKERVRFLVWGDSHAWSLGPVFDRLGREYGVQGILQATGAMAPLLEWRYSDGRTEKHPKTKQRWVQLTKSCVEQYDIEVVFLVGYWSTYATAEFQNELETTVDYFRERGIDVVLVLEVPTQRAANPVRKFAHYQRFGLEMSEPVRPTAHAERTRSVEQALSGSAVQKIDPAPRILSWRTLYQAGHSLYFDDDHLSDYGALQLTDLVEPYFIILRD